MKVGGQPACDWALQSLQVHGQSWCMLCHACLGAGGLTSTGLQDQAILLQMLVKAGRQSNAQLGSCLITPGSSHSSSGNFVMVPGCMGELLT